MSQKRPAVLFLHILLGTAILSFGLYNIHSQCSITEGGILGATLLLQHWFGISPAVTEFVLDIICYGLGLRFLGKAFLKYSLVATCCYSLLYAFYEQFPPVLPDLSAHPLAAAIVGAIFVGVGVGLAIRVGIAICGDDALALVLSKVSGQPITRAYLFTDLTVLLLSLSYIPWNQIIYSLITVSLSSYIIGKIEKWSGEKPAPADPLFGAETARK